ncbi:hypothetical protein ACFQ07_00695, partial [Actinomadura adrarensis]
APQFPPAYRDILAVLADHPEGPKDIALALGQSQPPSTVFLLVGALRLVPYLLPLPVFAFLPRVLELIAGGRGVTFVLLSHIWPTFLATVGLTAATGIMVTATRIRALLRQQRRQSASAPLHPQAHTSTTGT